MAEPNNTNPRPGPGPAQPHGPGPSPSLMGPGLAQGLVLELGPRLRSYCLLGPYGVDLVLALVPPP